MDKRSTQNARRKANRRLAAAPGYTAPAINQMYICGVHGMGTDFVTPSKEVAVKWMKENQWHFAGLVPVRYNANISDRRRHEI